LDHCAIQTINKKLRDLTPESERVALVTGLWRLPAHTVLILVLSGRKKFSLCPSFL